MKLNIITFGALAIALTSSTLVVGCQWGANHTKANKADFLVSSLETALPGYTITTVKLNSERGNWVVISSTNGGPVGYAAINLDLINTGMSAAVVYSTIVGAGPAGIESVAPTGTYGNFYVAGSGNVYEETTPTTKDLEKMGAVLESVKYADLSKNLVEKYGLSEERSFKVAKLASEWSRLSKSRSMTDADAENFSKGVVGFKISDAEAAYSRLQNGDSTQYNDLMNQAANLNGVSPEHMRSIVADIVGN